MISDWWDERHLAAARAMARRVEGKPCVHVGQDGTSFLCRRLSDVKVDETWVEGRCDWVEPADERPGELGDGFLVSHDCLVLGPDWWFDDYFGWYFVVDPALVDRSFAGDRSWVAAFLAPHGKGPAWRG